VVGARGFEPLTSSVSKSPRTVLYRPSECNHVRSRGRAVERTGCNRNHIATVARSTVGVPRRDQEGRRRRPVSGTEIRSSVTSCIS
jgi:hypothetical protein